MPPLPPDADVVEDAVAEAHRRAARSERDLGPAARHFAAVLPRVRDRWGLTARGWFDGGAGMPTLDVVRADGSAAVLKIAEPGSLDVAARVMRRARGRGYAEVLAWDARSGALLTERLGGDLWTEERTLAGQAPVVVALLRDAWRVPVELGAPFQGKAAGLTAILAELGPRYGDGHDRALRLAASCARDLAATEHPEVVCHGDPHGGNVLRRGRGWALIDPDGFVGERAYDLGVVLRDACVELEDAERESPGAGLSLLNDGCRLLAEAAGVDPERVWRWGLVERVTTGLYLGWHGHAEQSATFLRSASVIADAG